MKSNILNITLTILLPLLILSSCKSKKKAENFAGAPVPVVAYTVKEEHVVYYDTYPSTLVALNEIQLRSEVNGYITGIYFREGSHINKGDKLYEIDRRKYEAALNAARANVEISESNLQKAERDAERYKRLDEQNAIAKQVLDDGLTSLGNAQTQVKLAKANLLNAETDYNYSLIKAPFSGLIGFSLVKPGAFVSAGQTLLTSISSDDPIGSDFFIDQKSLPYILSLSKKNTPDTIPVFKVVLPDNSEYKLSGSLSVIDRAIDPLTGTIKIRVVFKNQEGSLRPGMNCKLKVLNENSGLKVIIPVKATIEQMGEFLVYLIENNKIVQKQITLGADLGQFVVVRDGLKPGDRIVLEGIQKVHEGSTVSFEDSVKMQASAKPIK
jgi:membrane fusion protein, multidrug efflux system